MVSDSQLYEAEKGELLLTATGDSLMSQPISPFREGRFLELLSLIRQSDIAFTNLETQIHRFEHNPSAVSGGTYTAAAPELLKELEWAGFGIVSSSNNHAYDYGEGGVLSTLENLEKSGLVFSGLGRNMSAARAPGYLESPVGRVALLSTTSTFPNAARAGEQRHDFHGRPGTSALGVRSEYVVDKSSFLELRRIRDTLGTEAEREHMRHLGFGGHQDSDREFHFLGENFVLGDDSTIRTYPDDNDLDDIMKWVREARRQADWVLMSVHSHEFNGLMEQPAEFFHTFARRSIDEGVDVVLGHGPHMLRGIEIYKGKPIFYSLGNFIFQNEAINRFPADLYNRAGLGANATPADYYDARTQKDTRGFPANSSYWESVVAVVNLNRSRQGYIHLHPVDLGYGRSRSQRGRPLVADKKLGDKILNRIRELSMVYGTEVQLRDGIGVVDLPLP